MAFIIPLIYVAVFVCAIFVADVVIGLWRRLSGFDDDTVARRLKGDGSAMGYPAAAAIAGTSTLLPSSFRLLETWLARLLMRAGVRATAWQIVGIVCVLAAIWFVVFALLLPARFLWLAFLAAALLSAGPILIYLNNKAAARSLRFDEQLPDALDLIVRSLRIGHPFSGAMQVVGREMPSPIGTEFAVACQQVAYGKDVSTAILEMEDRVGSRDLAYLSVAIQIQQEAGGNLVESLSNLSKVIRDRFRMFRKVVAITAEGRFSAWVLSFFPVLIATALTIVKPDYYTQVMNYKYFPQAVVFVVILLIINLIAMRIITNLKV